MKKLLLLFIPIAFLLSCGNDHEINAGSETYIGNWILKKYYYNDGMNGLYEGECSIPGSILVDDSSNQVLVPIECNLNTPFNIVFDVDVNGNLYNFENYNFLDKNYNIDSVSAQAFDISNVAGIDSISVYYKLSVPNGMYLTHITGYKIN
tara:strand:- start:591 stop:1040 length:450 start_codon:yes stop_codon:yes gene_type:complete